MRLRYWWIYRIYGMALPTTTHALDVVDCANPVLRATLTTAIGAFSQTHDEFWSLANQLVQGITGGGSAEGTPEERVAAGAAAIRVERVGQHGRGVYMFIECEGELDWEIGPNSREFGIGVLCLDGAGRGVMKAPYEAVVRRVLCAVSLAFPEIERIVHVSDAGVFLRPDGKPVFAYRPEVSATLSVSRQISEEQQADIGKQFARLGSHPDVHKTASLVATSLLQDNDALRAFLAGWSALEILVNKLYDVFELKFAESLLAGHASAGHKQYIERTREVMTKAVRLTDKFAVIAAGLSPATSAADLAEFKKLAKMRNRVSHGSDVPDSELPKTAPAALARRYLQLYISS